MDTIKNMMGSGSEKKPATQQTTESSSGGGWGEKLNSMAGGGKASEKNEDYLDKGLSAPCLVCETVANMDLQGVDFVQERVLGQGPQDNESAFEQAKDEQISDCKSPHSYAI